MRVGRGQFVVLLLTALAGSGALAFKISGQRWLDPGMTMNIGMSGIAPSGVAWSTALRQAMQRWTDNTAFTFVANEGYLDPCVGLSRNDSNGGAGFPLGRGDERNGTDFRTTVCGNSFGSGVLAITLSFSTFGPLGFPVLNQTDIIFNSNYQWDIYDGPLQSRIDFRRVALHELGHALGLDHESSSPAIMAPNYGGLHALQADDIAGANAIYDPGTCPIRDVAPSAAVSDSLSSTDCRVLDLFVGSDDTSHLDVYRLTLTKATDMDILVRSTAFDPVLILTDARLGGLEIHDDFEGSCDARIRERLPAGEYRILINTYVQPEKCALGTTGSYSLTLSESGLPLLGEVKNTTAGVTPANAVFTGGATANAGTTFPGTFTANQAIDVLGNIVPDPLHVDRPGRLYVLAVLTDGRRFVQNGNGSFVAFDGNLGNLVPRRTGILRAQENLAIAFGLKGSASGLSGQTVSVYIGYALDSKPLDIWYSGTPIRFTISP